MPLYRTSCTSARHERAEESPSPASARDSAHVLPQLAAYGPVFGPSQDAMCPLRASGASPGIAREFTIATLRAWGLADLADDATVVVSELVTNALRYGLPPLFGTADDRPIRLTLIRHGGLVVCVVADASREEPLVRDPCEISENGRGLHVIEALSRTWGWTPLPAAGKAVWAALAVPRA
ncbi:ATP-binding protein [Actinoallomurus purpureus]|uniref:ATP-binding protein n=1 Tax=Actinoallomurus purpureus TaxID=478114 RepID=UPI002092CB91|nr:ATP-binding protein [Actinoallomurus purpureus]MCO6006246.1 ATP-binding protein [Actinoallomurus purpureus]